MATIDQTVEAYALQKPLYDALRRRVEELLQALLREEKVDYHVIESRTKTLESFKEKIVRPGKSYKNPLDELSDLCGCRIIAYYFDDCDRIADVIKREFDVVEEELSHQPRELEPDRFGYLSAHYIVRISRARLRQTDWKPYKKMKVEIQVRTVIQHAWSAVSHALQYKDESRVPSKLQRRLYRIAGLFELADEEFVGIREQRRTLQEQAASAIRSGDTNIPLTTATISEFAQLWDGAKKLRKTAEDAGFKILGYAEEHSVSPEIISISLANDVTSIDQLERIIDVEDREYLKKISNAFIKQQKIPWPVTDDFLILLMLYKVFWGAATEKYFDEHGWDSDRASFVRRALEQ